MVHLGKTPVKNKKPKKTVKKLQKRKLHTATAIITTSAAPISTSAASLTTSTPATRTSLLNVFRKRFSSSSPTPALTSGPTSQSKLSITHFKLKSPHYHRICQFSTSAFDNSNIVDNTTSAGFAAGAAAAFNEGFTPGADISKVGKKAPQMDPNELESLLKQMEALTAQDDPYEKARGLNDETKKWHETETPDGWTPGEADPTFVMPDHLGQDATRPDLRSESVKEVTHGPKEKLSFQTETRKMLDIVTNSLYTDKEVFLRELVSNGSDALEKARYLGTRHQLRDADVPLEIRIFIDDVKKTITLQDTGIGMTKDELITNLGTIARSGSRQWVNDMKSTTGTDDIIGQFGVGFYSGFMVGGKIEVFSRSGKLTPESGKGNKILPDGSMSSADPAEEDIDPEVLNKHKKGYYWVSDGTGEYEISEADGVDRGTKIVIHLRPDQAHFASRQAVEQVLKKYSNFVGFPIYLNGLRVNTIQAIWNMPKHQVTEEQHDEFYRYLANAYDKPTYRMHFNADVPIQVNALFYFPERHMEKYGMGRMDPGTSLYSRKVLIKPKAKGLLPEYLRFVQGVVDSEDIPLNISRENMQDSLLISRISSVLTKRVIKHLQDEAKKDSSAYAKWYNEFGVFIREGICSDFTHKNELARLLRFDSSDSSVSPDAPTSLDDYISRMPPDQTQVYYLCAPNRKSAIESPYYESIKSSGYEVLFLYHPLDDFAMQNLREFNRRKLCSAESQAVEQSLVQQKKQLEMEQEYADLALYVKDVLQDRVLQVTVTDKVTKFPAFIVDHESSTMRKMMKMMDTQSMFGTEQAMPLAKQKLSINPTHPIFTKLTVIKDKQPTVAKAILEQVFDNALIQADLLDNPRDMLPRIQSILEMALDPTIVKQYEEEELGKKF